MSIRVQCSGCEKTLKAKDEWAGRRVKCPQCGQAVVIPGNAAEQLQHTSDHQTQKLRPTNKEQGIPNAPAKSSRETYAWLWYAVGGGGVVVAIAIAIAPLFLFKPEKILGLPNDFAFHKLTEARSQVDLITFLGPLDYVQLDSGRGFLRSKSSPDDSVWGLAGDPLNIEMIIRSKTGDGKADGSMFWTPEPFACYRKGKLLGVWNPSTRTFQQAPVQNTPLQTEWRAFFGSDVSQVSENIATPAPVPIVGTPRYVQYDELERAPLRYGYPLQGTGVDWKEPDEGACFILVELEVEHDRRLVIGEYVAVGNTGESYKPIGVRFGSSDHEFFKASFVTDQVHLEIGEKQLLGMKDGSVTDIQLVQPRLDLLYEYPKDVTLQYLRYGTDRYSVK